MTGQITLKDFDDVIADIGSRFPQLSDDDLFTLWFLRAYVTEDEDTAHASIVGAPNDKNLDAIVIDDNSHSVFIVQVKFRRSLGKVQEKGNDVIGFASVISEITTPNEDTFKAFLKKMDPLVEQRVRQARESILERGYQPWLYYATLGRISDVVQDTAKQRVRASGHQAKIEFIDYARSAILLRDYLDGVTPPVPALILEMESNPAVRVNGISQRYDENNEIESWVFSMRGDAIAKLYQSAGIRLFARNIRGFLGKDTAVNRSMVKTLEISPDRFFYYNNGITILCDEAKKDSQKGKDELHVSNPQVINGQQTTRTLASHPKLAGKATVLVKVIRVTRQPHHDKHFDDLVSSIVAGTNWQNPIRPSDLMTNHRTQVAIERELRKFGYAYLRRRQTKSETAKALGKKSVKIIPKEDMAQIVAACDIDARHSRSAREKLFSEQFYDRVFPNYEPLFYLTRYWAMNEVRRQAHGVQFNREARWLVLQAVWEFVRPILTTDNKRRAFVRLSEKKDPVIAESLKSAVEHLFVFAQKYYSSRKGKGEEMLPPPTFFKGKHGSGKPFLEELQQSVKTVAFMAKQMEKMAQALT